jgi:UDP-N-acetylglucosamine 2-epimerase (non-hydrolysing)
MRVVTVVGTRPEIIKLSRVITTLDACPAVEHTLIHTGQNYDYELNEIFFKEMGIRQPNSCLNAAEHHTLRANTPTETIAEMLVKLEDEFLRIKPDAILILGDTNSCVAAAYAAKRLHIPIFHMEAGNRCFDERVPEEANRRVVDHLSDINMPYTTLARENLMREGLPTDRTIKTGSPMAEIFSHYEEQIDESPVLTDMGLTTDEYFLVSVHREENVSQFGVPYCVLDAVAHKYGQRVIVSTHPRIAALVNTTILSPLVTFHKPFGFFDYNKLQRNARCVLSDSGTITEESSIQRFKAINLREAHERPEGMEEGSVQMTGMNVDRIISAIDRPRGDTDTPFDYLPTNVSYKVVNIILSYTDYVNRNVWGKR